MSSQSDRDEREARLLSTMLNMLTSGMSDPSRLSRGRTYARQGAVIDLHVDAGVLHGSVQGSRSQPYVVRAFVEPAAAFDTRTALLPERGELRFACTCPDWDDPCKHAVAVMVTFAEEVATDPSLLVRWRGGESAARTSRAVVGSRASGSAAPRQADDHALDVETRTALASFLGTRNEESEPETEVQPVSRLRPPAAAWGELWAEMLADALDALTGRDPAR
jgi:uncharacterized Zn finger protein